MFVCLAVLILPQGTWITLMKVQGMPISHSPIEHSVQHGFLDSLCMRKYAVLAGTTVSSMSTDNVPGDVGLKRNFYLNYAEK